MSVAVKIARPFLTARRNERHLPGEVGTWIFIVGDMLVFAVFFLDYLHSQAGQPELFEDSQRTLEPRYGFINTLVLLVSSLFVVVAMRAIRAGHTTVAPRMVSGAISCGLGFAVLKVLEYSSKVDQGLVPTTNDFFMYYFILTGLHFFHVLVGLCFLTLVFVASRKPVGPGKKMALIEGGTCYWHMVDLLWIVLFPLLYLVI